MAMGLVGGAGATEPPSPKFLGCFCVPVLWRDPSVCPCWASCPFSVRFGWGGVR